MKEIKVLFVVYHDLFTEARSLEMLMALNMTFDNVKCVCRKKPQGELADKCISPEENNGKSQYLAFMKMAKGAIKDYKPNILILHDEFTAPLIRMGHKRGMYLVYDSSELNIGRVLPGIKNKICKLLYFIENRDIHYVDLVFAANQERLNMMCHEMHILGETRVFDNMHRIDDDYDLDECEKKFGEIINRYDRYLVYGGGISHGRYTFKLAEDFSSLENVGLLIVGATTESSLQEYKRYIEEKHITNTHYLGFVKRGEFKYLLENAFASFVLFQANCPNTEFCASGKMYESLFVGTPIICSDNPPLVRLCKEYGVGESSMNFLESYKKIEAGYDTYVNNIKEYIGSIDYDNRIYKLGLSILDAYNNKNEKKQSISSMGNDE